MLDFFFLNLLLFAVAGSYPAPYSAVDDSLYDGNPPSAPKLQKLGLAFDFGNPIANGAIILIVVLNVIVYYLRELQESKLDDKEKQNYPLPLPSSEHQLCRRFSFGELQLATNKFDDASVIGRGGYGKVYKGIIDSGASIVAIKRLKPGSHQGAPEFWAEIELLSRFRHSHLVPLIGYCDECHEMILVYKYMPRGTLADHLHKIDKSSHAPLSWVQRLKICIGAAHGLDYLHTGTGVKDRVIHRDVKSSNILLDEDWEAKISDFGMSKVGPANQSCTHVSTHVKGTFGYLDPDYHLTGQLTRKSDVYSFGVVLFEVLCGRPAVDTRLDDEEQWGLAEWVKHCIKEGKMNQIIDPSLQGKILSDCLTVFVQIAEQCLHNRPKKRPTMAEVVVRLEYALALQEGTYYLMVEEESSNSSEEYDNQDDGCSSVEHEVITASNDGHNVQPIEGDLGREKLAGEGFSVEGEGNVDSSIKTGGGGHHTKHIYDDIRLGDASSRQSRTWPPRLPFWKRFQWFLLGSASVNSGGPFSGEYSTPNNLQLSYKAIRVATNKFSRTRILGSDEYGSTYKGILPNGQEIAVKRMYMDNEQDVWKLLSEIVLLAELQHPNLVRLLGFCIKADKVLLLIYEFSANRSVADHLFDPVKRQHLDWHKRRKIIEGVARGLLYLHEGHRVRIIHRYLIVDNVLLDIEMNPKISEFGLAECREAQRFVTRTERECGYIAPESLVHGHYSMKSDVYSFGMLVLEIVSGHGARAFFHIGENAGFSLEHATTCWKEGTCLNLVDPILKADTSSIQEIMGCIGIGLLCVQLRAADRPSMAAVVHMLSDPSLDFAMLRHRPRHPNLVRILGFCFRRSEVLLIHEFLPNANVAYYLFDLVEHPHLDWHRRWKIIEGDALGLLYLHEGSQVRIIHRDLTPDNVLLDIEMNPKILEFGLSSGYLAPECISHGQHSTKSNVFSFGVLVLETLSGQSSASFPQSSKNAEDLLGYAWKCWQKGTCLNLVDPILKADTSSMEDIVRCVHIGLLCVQELAADRPSMAEVVPMLSRPSITLPTPLEPPCFKHGSIGS